MQGVVNLPDTPGMINRLLIRIKVLQILYNYYLVDSMTGEQALSILKVALDHSYRLYIYLCGLPIHVSRAARRRLEIETSKLSPSAELIDLLERLEDNEMVRAVSAGEGFEGLLDTYTPDSVSFSAYYDKAIIDLSKDEAFDAWREMTDMELWKQIYRHFFFSNDDFYQLLEGMSAYIADDIEIVFSFVTKVFNALSEGMEMTQALRPKYTHPDEERFGIELLRNAISHKEEYRKYLSQYFKNWDKERVSEMDYLILQLAMTEAIHNPDIATQVTINEYLNLGRYYSSPNSNVFINGILHQAFMDLKSEGRILGA